MKAYQEYTAEADELMALAMEADLIMREARARVEGFNIRMANIEKDLGIDQHAAHATTRAVVDGAKARRDPPWDYPSLEIEQSLNDTRRHWENTYLAAVVEFLHSIAVLNASQYAAQHQGHDGPLSHHTLFGHPVTIDTDALNEFLCFLDDKQKKLWGFALGKTDDPNFLGDIDTYRIIAAKPLVRERLSIDRELLSKKGLDLALKQAEKNEFGWTSDSEQSNPL